MILFYYFIILFSFYLNVQLWIVLSVLYNIFYLVTGKYKLLKFDKLWILFFAYIIFTAIINLKFDIQYLQKIILQISVLLNFYFLIYSNYQKRIVNYLFILILSFGLIQVVCFKLGLAFEITPYYSGRGLHGYQLTSIFPESAHLTGLLIAFFYIFSHSLNKSMELILFGLLIIVFLLTISASAILSLLILVFILIIKSIKGFYFLKFLPLLLLLVFQKPLIEKNYNRLITESFQYLNQLGAYPITPEDAKGKSSFLRTINEFNYILNLNIKDLVFGTGVNYGGFYEIRKMGLNGLVEFILRFGIIGLIFLVNFFYLESKRNKQNSYLFLISLLLIFTADGATAKIAFWLPIVMIITFNRKFKYQNDKNLHFNNVL